MVRLVNFEKNKKLKIKTVPRAKAWAPQIKKLGLKQTYFFKGRLGKKSATVLHAVSKFPRSHCFLLQTAEVGHITTPQMEIMWRLIRRRTRRFRVNLRRLAVCTKLQLTATKTQTRRKKGGRMGSGKSTVGNVSAFLKTGKIFFQASEVRKKPLIGFLPFRALLKKVSLKAKIKYTL